MSVKDKRFKRGLVKKGGVFEGALWNYVDYRTMNAMKKSDTLPLT